MIRVDYARPATVSDAVKAGTPEIAAFLARSRWSTSTA